MQDINLKSSILESLKDKAELKYKVYDNTKAAFNLLKEVLKEIADEYNNETKLISNDQRLMFVYEERTDNDISLRVASELLIFSLHSNIFQFNRENEIWNNPYVMISPANAYSGMITMYNFLSDSFQYSRMEDLGYLICRIFVNRQNHFLVEGKRQIGYKQENFEKAIVSKESLKTVVETALNYTINFDLLVTLYDNIKNDSVT